MTVSLGNVTVGASAANFTALAYDGVPEVVRLQVDRAMDDRSPGTGAVQTFPPAALGAAGRLIIIIGPMH
ncbi:MAG: hypothetical protein DDT25_01290 [Chloroflexi bacterium]|nr:hypothetical protein [Chloroflexota bacterium]